MINVNQSAQEYFARLLQQQDATDLGLKLMVEGGGLPSASCHLEFCALDLSADAFEQQLFPGFTLFYAKSDTDYLKNAEIDYEENETGGELEISAPHIKGAKPNAEAAFDEQIQYFLDSEINPQLASHGGQVRLMSISADNDIVLLFGGGCQGCGMIDVTLKDGIEGKLKAQFPELGKVIDSTDHQLGTNPYY